MPFQFMCPQGHLLEAEESQAGQSCGCPICGAAFIIPSPPPGAMVQPVIPAPTQSPAYGTAPLGGGPPQPYLQPAPGYAPRQPYPPSPAHYAPPPGGGYYAPQAGPYYPSPPLHEAHPTAAYAPAADPYADPRADQQAEQSFYEHLSAPVDSSAFMPGEVGEQPTTSDAMHQEPIADRLAIEATALTPEVGLSVGGPAVYHIPCPNGHPLECPVDMLDQEVLCPECHVQFRLSEKDSVEHKQRREQARALREAKQGNLWLTWSIVFAVVIVVALIVMAIVAGSS